jgi:hypothetical protein
MTDAEKMLKWLEQQKMAPLPGPGEPWYLEFEDGSIITWGVHGGHEGFIAKDAQGKTVGHW